MHAPGNISVYIKLGPIITGSVERRNDAAIPAAVKNFRQRIGVNVEI